MSGLIDWDVIEDRIRVPAMPNQFNDLSHLVRAAVSAYRLDRWENQEYYVEVWVEKDALYGILEPITRKYHVHLLVNRGYSSTSALHESVLRIKKQQDYKECVKEFGRISWELDALNPDVLSELISSNIEKRLDADEYQRVIDREDEEKQELVRVSEAI